MALGVVVGELEPRSPFQTHPLEVVVALAAHQKGPGRGVADDREAKGPDAVEDPPHLLVGVRELVGEEVDAARLGHVGPAGAQGAVDVPVEGLGKSTAAGPTGSVESATITSKAASFPAT